MKEFDLVCGPWTLIEDGSATTRSAISAGTINITNPGAQTQDVANLSRDTTNTNGTVANTPDVNTLLNQQADTMQAAQAAGQVVAQGIGAYADHKRDTTTDPATAAAWDEGGADRTLAHIAGGALIGGLGGGSAFSTIRGAAGAGFASTAAPGLADIANGVSSATGSELIGNLAANLAAGLGGAIIGGTAGAATGSAVQLYNQSLDNKKSLLSKVCDGSAPCNPSLVMAAVNAEGANAQTASDNMKTEALYGVPAAAVIALGPEAVTAALLAGGYDYGGSYYSYKNGLSPDAPNFTNSYITGIIGGLSTPFMIGDAAIAGMGAAGKIAANTYNAGVTGVGAFGSAGMTSSNPDLSAGVATATTAAGSFAKAVLPPPLGNLVNQIMQGSAGPIQAAIQYRK
jgi:filamentous hemagglutinin